MVSWEGQTLVVCTLKSKIHPIHIQFEPNQFCLKEHIGEQAYKFSDPNSQWVAPEFHKVTPCSVGVKIGQTLCLAKLSGT